VSPGKIFPLILFTCPYAEFFLWKYDRLDVRVKAGDLSFGIAFGKTGVGLK